MAWDDAKGMKIAIDEAVKGLNEGGVPIGGCLMTEDGEVLGSGRNLRIQKSSATLHGEISTLENAGRLKGNVYKNCTMYTTLSPCDMCTGAILMYGIKRVVMGENDTFVGGEDYLRQRGVEVVNLDNQECKDLMAKFIKEKPEEWNEDIGTE
ncbi:Cytosine deaminase [Cyberlindnera fabianii]|uniref:Cytosine deaminase n=1 Tax=Cyberlindnera fabianii TaxID=36022 RepID=A0A1V2LAL1_CYBFA|nr:Cytosine deaminase [Cyberlindnera fabianii]